MNAPRATPLDYLAALGAFCAIVGSLGICFALAGFAAASKKLTESVAAGR